MNTRCQHLKDARNVAPDVTPGTEGCEECLATGEAWVHLRLCEACGHVHMPPPQALERGRLREMAGVVLAAGSRPCAGAIVVLVFALSQGLFPAGVAAAFAMALGTALTTGAIAALAVFAKALALRFAGGRGTGETAIAGVELLASAFVLVLGLSLLAGMWSAAAS